MLKQRLPCEVWGGELSVDDEVFDNCIPTPLEREGEVRLRLECAAAIYVSGSTVRLELLGEPTYLEEFPGVTST